MPQTHRLLHDRYELGRRLGGGVGSATHLAIDHDTGQPCVVKALSVGEVVRGADRAPSYDSADFTKVVELFEREARVLAHLDHPGVPRFIDHFTESTAEDTRLYTVQEYVAGETLQTLVGRGRHFTEGEARDLCRQAAEVLAYLHGRSPPLIHRDIKPDNLILDEDGTLHLVDFGSVRTAMGGDELDGKTIVGTYGYMPVEQYEARALPQSDFYALGMTLVFVLSHREPTDIARSGMVLEFRPHVNVSDAFARVLQRLIEPAPEDRYPSASELLRALADPTGGAGRPLPVERAGARRLVATAGAAAALVVAAAVSFLFVGSDATVPAAATTDESQGPPEGRPPGPVLPVEGVLSIDIHRDFRYVPTGWPMGRSVGQTAIADLTARPFEDLTVPTEWRARDAEVRYGFFPLGNGPDRRIAFALVRDGGAWSLSVDLDNDEDLTDDGPPVYNEGTGMFAAEVGPLVETVSEAGRAVTRPYHLWAWFDAPDRGGRIRGRFYARNHYAGSLLVGERTYQATAFEFRDHDALYRDSGLCIDLSGDGECQEDDELFRDGDVVDFPGEAYPLALRYP